MKSGAHLHRVRNLPFLVEICYTTADTYIMIQTVIFNKKLHVYYSTAQMDSVMSVDVSILSSVCDSLYAAFYHDSILLAHILT